MAKEGRQRQNQTTHTKQDVPKQRKKILPTSRGEMGEDIPTTGCEKSKKILKQDIGTERS